MPRWFWIVLAAFAVVYAATVVIAGSTDALGAGVLIIALVALGGLVFTVLGRRGGEPHASKHARGPLHGR